DVEPVRIRPLAQRVERGAFAIVGCDDRLAALGDRNAVFPAEAPGLRSARLAEPRLQAAGRIIAAGLVHAGIVSRLMPTGPIFLRGLRDPHAWAPATQIIRRGAADAPRADYDVARTCHAFHARSRFAPLKLTAPPEKFDTQGGARLGVRSGSARRRGR